MGCTSQTTVDFKDTVEAAQAAGLTYVTTDEPGIARKRSGKGFSYTLPSGGRVTDAATLKRIKALVVPPAWTRVWICANDHGHIQAVGYDEKGRKQYRYHARFREVRDGAKFTHMMAFAEALPAIRRQVAIDMAKPGLGREKVLATIVHLLETTMIRVGNSTYAKENKSYGLTTLLDRHVKVEGSALRFHFKGKSGKIWKLGVQDRRVARIVKNCQDLPGQHLFQYLDSDGAQQAVSSADVNAYLKEISGSDVTAKDFRTWTGTVLAAMALAEFESADSQARAKKNVTQAIERVSARLGNTPTICRKCYIHPEVVNAYLSGGLLLEVREEIDAELKDSLSTLRPEEAAVLAFLRARVVRDFAAEAAKDAAKPAPAERRKVRASAQPRPALRRRHPDHGQETAPLNAQCRPLRKGPAGFPPALPCQMTASTRPNSTVSLASMYQLDGARRRAFSKVTFEPRTRSSKPSFWMAIDALISLSTPSTRRRRWSAAR